LFLQFGNFWLFLVVRRCFCETANEQESALSLPVFVACVGFVDGFR
jgi:hypothetical protein